MFTHEVTPTRLETLIDLLRSSKERHWTKETVLRLLQPEGLPAVNLKREQSKSAVSAGKELGLVEERDSGYLTLTFSLNDSRDTRTIIRDAVDRRMLGTLDAEPYFGPFYSYMLGLGIQPAQKKSNEQWAAGFRGCYSPAAGKNPFNATKFTGLHRWYHYAGMGWYDSAKEFHCNPYERVRRRLPNLFGNDRHLSSTEFMDCLAKTCPELDGGEFFRAVNSEYNPRDRRCTLGLSHALIELHLDGVLRLHCPPDNDGWHIDVAAPPRDKELIRSSRIDRIEWLCQKES